MITSTELTAYASVILSLVLSYWPGLNTWYAALEAETKRLIMLGLLVLVAGAIFGLACSGLGADLGISVTCDRSGAMGLVKAFLAAVLANQGAFLITPKAQAVKRILDAK